MSAYNVASIDTVAEISTTKVPASTNVIEVAGYYTVGVGAFYAQRVASEPSNSWKFRSADRYLPDGTYDNTNGGWWEGFTTNGLANVMAFGADPTNTSDCGTAFTNCLTYCSTVGAAMVVPVGNYKLTTSAVIPSTIATGSLSIEMDQGAVLHPIGAIVALDRWQTNQTNADASVSNKVIITGGKISGDRTSGQIGIRVGATYGSEIHNTAIEACDIGVKIAFGLKTLLCNVMTASNPTGGISIESGSGNWTGGNISNSQSNHSVIFSCRDYAYTAASYQYQVLASSGVAIRDSIAEGGDPVNAIVFDDQYSTVSKTFTVDNLHNENTPSNAIFKLAGTGGATIRLSQIYREYPAAFLDCSNFGASTLSIENIPYALNMASPAFICSSNMIEDGCFEFENFGQSTDLTDPSYWSSGSVPANLYHINYVAAGGGIQIQTGNLTLGDHSTTPTDLASIWLRMNGALQCHSNFMTVSTAMTLSSGANENISDPCASFAQITGPTGVFSVGGIRCDNNHQDGRILYLQNTTSYSMVILNESSSSASVWRIKTLSGENLALPGPSFATLQYSHADQRWLVTSFSPPLITTPLSPSALSGLLCWYDMGPPNAYVIDTGSQLKQWTDLSGNSNHLINNVTGATQPTRLTPAANGFSAIRFTSANSQKFSLTSTIDLSSSDWTMVACVKRGGPSGTNIVQLFGVAATPAAFSLEWGNSGTFYVAGPTEYMGSITVDTDQTNFHVIAITCSGGIPQKLFEDGISISLGSPTSFTGSNAFDTFGYGDSRYSNCDIRSAAIYNRVLTDTEIAQLTLSMQIIT